MASPSDEERQRILYSMFDDLLNPLNEQQAMHDAMLNFCKTRLHQNGLLFILPTVMTAQAQAGGGNLEVGLGNRETKITLHVRFIDTSP